MIWIDKDTGHKVEVFGPITRPKKLRPLRTGHVSIANTGQFLVFTDGGLVMAYDEEELLKQFERVNG